MPVARSSFNRLQSAFVETDCIYGSRTFVLLPAGCHGNLPVLNLLSASVAKNQHFSPLQEKLCVGSKNDGQLLELSRHDILYQHAKFGEIELRAPAVGAKIGVFLYVTLGLPARGGHSSNKYCVMVYGSILMQFSALFSEWIVFSVY